MHGANIDFLTWLKLGVGLVPLIEQTLTIASDFWWQQWSARDGFYEDQKIEKDARDDGEHQHQGIVHELWYHLELHQHRQAGSLHDHKAVNWCECWDEVDKCYPQVHVLWFHLQNVKVTLRLIYKIYRSNNNSSQGVKCIFLVEPGKWVQSFFLNVFMLYRYCTPWNCMMAFLQHWAFLYNTFYKIALIGTQNNGFTRFEK